MAKLLGTGRMAPLLSRLDRTGLATVLLVPFLSLIIPPRSISQILEHPEARYFGNDPFFNEDFIRRNEIRTIETNISTKRQMDRVRKSGTEEFYRFDQEGQLITQYESYVHHDSIRDTVFIHYEYTDEGRLARVLRNDLHGFYAYEYAYDSLGRLSKERYLRIENKGPSRYQFEPGREFVIDEESYKYRQPRDTMLVQDFYNSEGRIYRRKIHYRDTLGYLKRVTSRYMITHKQGITRYSYNAQGRVTERMEDPDISDTTKKHYTFAYDSIGNLLEWDIYRNDHKKAHHEYLYRDSTMLLDAEIKKDEETLLITITRFEYGFFGKPLRPKKDSTLGGKSGRRKGRNEH